MEKSSKNLNSDKGYVCTVKDRCRVCYTCVRECPAKAIRIADGQAEVVAKRCIACGNCVKVCSQDAKQFVHAIDEVSVLLKSDATVVACVAPSFPAEFHVEDYRLFVGMLKKMGFSKVVEVAFGADLVAKHYKDILKKEESSYIATTCPSVVNFVEKYHPDSLSSLAPIVSPMVAMARVLRQDLGKDIKVVFIGPCVAKKAEAEQVAVQGEIDEVLTFKELKIMLKNSDITPTSVEPEDFDPPHGGLGALFPITGGMLQTANLQEDLVGDEIVSADGLHEFVPAIEEFSNRKMDVKLLEVLSCSGCISGPGMDSNEPKFRRRSRVSAYVRSRVNDKQRAEHEKNMERFKGINLYRDFFADDQRINIPSSKEIDEILHRFGKFSYNDELNCGACGYSTCRAHAVAIHKGLAEDEMCLPYIIDRLKDTVKQLSESHSKLANTQDQLMQSEKLASMGQLAAGVAHELNNPLGVVLMYSHLLLDEITSEEPLYDDLKMITKQAERSKKIVSNLLDFARENKLLIEEVYLENVIESSVNNTSKPDNVDVEIKLEHSNSICEIDQDQMIQVFTNIISNAYGAMEAGGTLTIKTSDTEDDVKIAFEDSGTGIEKDNIEKVFQPFFTTKKIGKGTGLGLSVSYGIVKMHRGQITVTSNTDESKGPVGTKFIVQLPRRNA